MDNQENFESIQDSCIDAGLKLGRAPGYYQTPRVIGLKKELAKAPHSELCMHVGCAGQQIIGWKCERYEDDSPKYCYITYQDKDGFCHYTSGRPAEVLPHEVLKLLGKISK